MTTRNLVKNDRWTEKRWMRSELMLERISPWKALYWAKKARPQRVQTLRKLSPVIEQLLVAKSQRRALAA